jgi:signal transduction histidine kinase
MPSFSQVPEADPRILQALSSLNQIGSAINLTNPSGWEDVKSTLKLIAESATHVVPGAGAVIYTFDFSHKTFDPTSRVSAGERSPLLPEDHPRPAGIGMRALQKGRRVISYEEPDLDINPEIARAGARVVACFPLIAAEQPLGALYIYLFEERSFTQLEEMMVENFVNLAAMALFQVFRFINMRDDLARKEEELSQLRRSGLLISSRLKLEETLEAILQMALEVTDARYGIFRLVDKTGQNLMTRAIAGAELSRPKVDALPVDDHSVMGWVCRNRQPVLIHDLSQEPWSRIYYPLDAEMQMRSELAVPLIDAGGRVEGVLNLESPLVGAFSEPDSHLLQALATQAVTAIQEARLLDALQEAARLLITHTSREVLSRLVELACDLLNASSAHIWLREGEWLKLDAVHGDIEHDRRLPLRESLTGEAILKRALVSAHDVREDDRFHRRDLAREQNWTGALVMPLMIGDEEEPIGAFSVYSTGSESGRFAESDWDKKILTCLAHYAVLAIQNAGNQEALRSMQEQHAVAETFAAVGDVAANLLHQLNNKVGTIPVRIQGIQDKCAQSLAADTYLAANLAEIERSANEAMASVRENLSHLRPIHLAEVDVAGCVREAVEIAALPAGIKVDLIELDTLPRVIAGQRNLTLVFVNQLENASDAMEGRGQITIRGRSLGRQIEITVSDTGPGIPPSLHAKIFELNYTGRGQVRPGKLGFGLWWVKTVMARLGGSIAVESDGVQGTTFRLRLPAAETNS